MSIKQNLLFSALVLLSAPALSGNADLVRKVVRVQVSEGAGGLVSGKLTRFDGCLYVQLDKPTAGGIQSMRLDQVLGLQVFENGRWTPRVVESVLKREPSHCLAEANG